jgi:hypothetical protein
MVLLFFIIHHIFCILATALLLWTDRAGNTHAPFPRAAKSGWLHGSATVSGILGWNEKGRDEMRWNWGSFFESPFFKKVCPVCAAGIFVGTTM